MWTNSAPWSSNTVSTGKELLKQTISLSDSIMLSAKVVGTTGRHRHQSVEVRSYTRRAGIRACCQTCAKSCATFAPPSKLISRGQIIRQKIGVEELIRRENKPFPSRKVRKVQVDFFRERKKTNQNTRAYLL